MQLSYFPQVYSHSYRSDSQNLGDRKLDAPIIFFFESKDKYDTEAEGAWEDGCYLLTPYLLLLTQNL